MKRRSRLKGFYKLSLNERLRTVKEFASLTDEEVEMLKQGRPEMGSVEQMVENVVGVIGIPFGIATNFLINGRDYLIPMATDESSVIAAASNGAKIARAKGGFTTSSTGPIMAVHIQVDNTKEPEAAAAKISEHRQDLLDLANTRSRTLPRLGGGAKDIKIDIVKGWYGPMVVIRLIVDVRDAMGANVVNTMAEFIAPTVEKISGGRVYLKVVDNYAIERLARASCVVDKDLLGGSEIVEAMLRGYSFAYYDQHRATGHNKGVMNGITALVLATGNDTRAVESAFHSYAARDGRYRALPVWEKNEDGDLTGFLEMPAPVGIIGGMTMLHPVAKIAIKILGVKSADELSQVLAAVGLASKLAAERALAAEGIQYGHMRLHATNIAAMAGAKSQEIDLIARRMIEKGKISLGLAEELLKEQRDRCRG